ncbi:hypothetical protein ACWD0G_27335, partial [Streptomyces goshikiensis]
VFWSYGWAMLLYPLWYWVFPTYTDQPGLELFASTSRQTGSTLGVAVIGAVLAAGMAGGRDFESATGPAWWIITLCGAFVLVVGAVSSGPWAMATAERTARTLEPPHADRAPAGAPPHS